MTIMSVLGLIRNADLGFCHSHEHLFIAEGIPAQINPALRIDDYEKTIQELLLYKQVGGKAIVDAQPLGCGRMATLLLEASRESGIHIIASTGFHKLAFYSNNHWIRSFDESKLTEIFIQELTVGMFDHTDDAEPVTTSNAKAGIIKTAMDEERMNDAEKKWFRAAAKAAIETGAPIMCHIESSEQAVEIVRFYQHLGVNNEQIIICHLDRKLDRIDVHKQLAEQGIYLEYDTIGRFKYHSDEEEAHFIKQMVDCGFEDSILLGLDTTRERLKSYGAAVGLDHLSIRFIPLLRNLGISEIAIHKIMIDNPAKAFCNKRVV
jgi:predicted metal-dependent phosphotriesterase family hydrolase